MNECMKGENFLIFIDGNDKIVQRSYAFFGCIYDIQCIEFKPLRMNISLTVHFIDI